MLVGLIVMGGLLPAALYFLLPLDTLAEFLTVSATCFFSWGVADLTANILARPRLENRSPGGAIRDYRDQKRSENDRDP